jgi:hypothetical protein
VVCRLPDSVKPSGGLFEPEGGDVTRQPKKYRQRRASPAPGIAAATATSATCEAHY